MFNWFGLIAAIPSLVQAAQFIHAGQPGATKKQKVFEWLGLGEAALAQANPTLGGLAVNITQEIGAIIDNVVSASKKTGQPGFTAALPAAATAAHAG